MPTLMNVTNLLLGNRAVGISFKRAASQIFSQPVKRLQTLYMRKDQAGKAPVITASAFWGCPGLNFTANLPFNEMREGFAARLKKIPAALITLFSIR